MVYGIDEKNSSHRSIHQNDHGYLPFKREKPSINQKKSKKDNENIRGKEHTVFESVSAPFIALQAAKYGELPDKQADKNLNTNGNFLEFTCGDNLSDKCRFVVDYRFGFIYMTFGHYHRDSFALLVRSEVEITFELKPTLSTLEATFEG
jgi:hypothetical protein